MKTMIIHFASALGILLSMLFSGSSDNKFIKSIRRYTNAETNKEVIFVPLAHLGTETQYKRVKDCLDSLKHNGYVTFYEGLLPIPINSTSSEINSIDLIATIESYIQTDYDSLYIDTLLRKARAIIECNAFGGYNEPDNNSLPKSIQRMSNSGKYVEQDIENLGLTTEKDIWCDYSLDQLVELYEQDYGKINLMPYDFQTPLNSPYDSPHTRSEWAFTHKYRESLIIERILKSQHPKIVVVYGAAHIGMLTLDLKSFHGYEKDKKFKIK